MSVPTDREQRAANFRAQLVRDAEDRLDADPAGILAGTFRETARAYSPDNYPPGTPQGDPDGPTFWDRPGGGGA